MLHQIMPFAIPLGVELVAVGLGAVQGALFASALTDRRIDVLGVVITGLGLALGGSVLRDILLGQAPVVIFGPWYVLVAAVAALLGMWLQRLFTSLEPVILPLDALTIGLFGAIGTSKALALDVPPVPAVLVGAMSAVGGSVIRDVILDLPVALLHVGSLYAIAAAAGAALLVLLVTVGAELVDAAIAGVVLTTAVRLLAIRFGWSFPEQRALVVRRRRTRRLA
ncbi:TRIC cation channel family protein [Actinotalea sp. BY-33]|uniref:TRIC cation channel family protein n=1 Tax=Actinotalea soli TaxID=2819234 RepID=A0A939RUD8_9CELL|nr:TRIC cation channel family protein [Actinotalea soli]MBO1752529.1 TRIC cation channel family protein [Actinotalea soli]